MPCSQVLIICHHLARKLFWFPVKAQGLMDGTPKFGCLFYDLHMILLWKCSRETLRRCVISPMLELYQLEGLKLWIKAWNPQKNGSHLPTVSSKLVGWEICKIPKLSGVFNRKVIYKWRMIHCHG